MQGVLEKEICHGSWLLLANFRVRVLTHTEMLKWLNFHVLAKQPGESDPGHSPVLLPGVGHYSIRVPPDTYSTSNMVT